MALQDYFSNVSISDLAGTRVPIHRIDSFLLGNAWKRETSLDRAKIEVQNNASLRNQVINVIQAMVVPYSDDYLSSSANTVTFRTPTDSEGNFLVLNMYKSGNDLNVLWGLTTKNDSTSNYRSNGSYVGAGQDKRYFTSIYCPQSRFPSNLGWLLVVDSETHEEYIGYCCLWTNYNTISKIDFLKLSDLHYQPEIVDPDLPDPSKPGGYDGGGGRGHGSDNIPIPPDPSINISQLGYLNVYKVSTSGLSGMIEELFPDLDNPIFPTPTGEGALSDIANSLNAVGSGLVNFCINFANSNITNYIIDTHLIPVSPQVGASQNIKAGFRSLSVSAPMVSHDYVTHDCGTLNIAELYSNFVDWVGTQILLYLPFVGYVPLQPEYVLGGSLNVTYKFNIIDGSFTAFVVSSSGKSALRNTVIGEYSGNCAIHIPIVSSDYASIVTGLVSAVSSNVGALSATNTLGGLPDKPFFNQSNGFNATSAYLGVRRPYLILKTRVPSFPSNYGHMEGFPLNVTGKLKNYSGFTVCEGVHVDNIARASASEKDQLKRLLENGIVL